MKAIKIWRDLKNAQDKGDLSEVARLAFELAHECGHFNNEEECSPFMFMGLEGSVLFFKHRTTREYNNFIVPNSLRLNSILLAGVS